MYLGEDDKFERVVFTGREDITASRADLEEKLVDFGTGIDDSFVVMDGGFLTSKLRRLEVARLNFEVARLNFEVVVSCRFS